MAKLANKLKNTLSKTLDKFLSKNIYIITYKEVTGSSIYSYDRTKIEIDKRLQVRGFIDIGRDLLEYKSGRSITVENGLVLFLSDDLKKANLWDYAKNRTILKQGDMIELTGEVYTIRATDDKTPLIEDESIISQFEFYKAGN